MWKLLAYENKLKEQYHLWKRYIKEVQKWQKTKTERENTYKCLLVRSILTSHSRNWSFFSRWSAIIGKRRRPPFSDFVYLRKQKFTDKILYYSWSTPWKISNFLIPCVVVSPMESVKVIDPELPCMHEKT